MLHEENSMKCIIALSLLTLSLFNAPAMANYYRFYANQVYDVQRTPAFPLANDKFTVYSFSKPFTANLKPYTLEYGEYVQLFFVGGICQDGKVGINRYNARGYLLETVQPTGHIYGLSPEGFLHDNDQNVGTFFSMRPINENNISYTPTSGPEPETCATLQNLIRN